MRRDPYQTLGLPPGASAEQIRSAYRQLARQYHPDCSGCPETAERFRSITEAYNQLTCAQGPAAGEQPRRSQRSVRIHVRAGSSEMPPVAARAPAADPGYRRRPSVAPEPLVPPRRRPLASYPRTLHSDLSLLLWLLSDDVFRR